MKFLTIRSPLKGSRSYLHGSDITFELTKFVLAQGGDKIELSLNAFSKNEVFCISGVDLPVSSRRIGYGSWSDPVGEVNKFLLVEGSEELKSRRKYDEDNIESKCTIEIEGITGYQNDLRDYHLFEIIIAMKKVYLNSKYPNSDVKWWFAKLNLASIKSYFFENNNKIEIIYKKSLGLKLVISDIYINGSLSGQISFTSTGKDDF